MSQSRSYSTFVCPCGFEAKRNGQETVKKLETIARLHALKCEKHRSKPTKYNLTELKVTKKDAFRENECREVHNIWVDTMTKLKKSLN